MNRFKGLLRNCLAAAANYAEQAEADGLKGDAVAPGASAWPAARKAVEAVLAEHQCVIDERDALLAALETAVRWLRRLEADYPGCLNDDAIDKHLAPALDLAKSST